MRRLRFRNVCDQITKTGANMMREIQIQNKYNTVNQLYLKKKIKITKDLLKKRTYSPYYTNK